MSSPLHKSPQGLLESFALKTLGEAPQKFGDEVNPVVEALEFYTTGLLFAAQAAAATVGAFNQTIVVPYSNGVALLRAMGVDYVNGAGAGTFLHWALGVRVQSATIVSWLANGSFGAIAAGATRRWGFMIPQRVILPPQSSLVMFATSDAAGADHSFRLNWLTTEVNAIGVG
jgi:hypothetical protein